MVMIGDQATLYTGGRPDTLPDYLIAFSPFSVTSLIPVLFIGAKDLKEVQETEGMELVFCRHW